MLNFFLRNISIAIFFTCIPVFTFAQNADLAAADSLFANQKYTDAMEIYEQIFENKEASPAMLTKMAYIQEGLGNFSDALYYLNLYYLKTSDKAAVNKMRELAEKNNLTGYEYSDLKFILGISRQYRSEILLGLILFSAILFIYAWRKIKHKEKPVFSAVWQLLTLIAIISLNNRFFDTKGGIINQDHTLLMTGPSAGSEPIDFVNKGNKVIVLGSDEIWSKVQYGETEAYVRSKNIRIL